MVRWADGVSKGMGAEQPGVRRDPRQRQVHLIQSLCRVPVFLEPVSKCQWWEEKELSEPRPHLSWLPTHLGSW